MATVAETSTARLPAAPWGFLPPRMRVLLVTGSQRTGQWLARALASDSASEVELEEALGVTEGMAHLRDEVFDAILIGHQPPELDALDVLEGVQAGSHASQPVVVLGEASEAEMAALCFEVGADAYVCVNDTTTRTLIWQVARAIQRCRLMEENRRYRQSQDHRRNLEHEEASRLLAQQRALVEPNDQLGELPSEEEPSAGRDRTTSLPDRLVQHYHELLEAYVIMGSGHLGEELRELADLLATAGVTSQQAMLLHLEVLEQLVGGLGSRSARHVMSRADLLILEVMMHLAECYRRRSYERSHPPRQLPLPGFDDQAVAFG